MGEAYGSALAKLAATHPRVVALDGDMKNSTFSQSIKKVDQNRYIECFICEQNLVGVGIGVACRDRNVVVKKLAVNAVPRSGPPMELLEMFGISASHIVKA